MTLHLHDRVILRNPTVADSWAGIVTGVTPVISVTAFVASHADQTRLINSIHHDDPPMVGGVIVGLRGVEPSHIHRVDNWEDGRESAT